MRFVWVLAGVFLCQPVLVIAQEGSDSERAQNLYRRATLAFEAEEWSEAAELYARAHALEPHPELLYNLALSQERSLQDEEALATYRAFIAATDEGAPKRDEARSRANTLETRLRTPAGVPAVSEPSVGASNAGPTVLVVAGAASTLAAAGTLVGRLVLRSSLEGACVDGGCEAPQHASVDRYHRLGVTSWVLLGVGVATTLVGVLLWSKGDARLEASTDGQRLVVRGTF